MTIRSITIRHRFVPALAGLGIMLTVLGCGSPGSPGSSPADSGSPGATTAPTGASVAASLDGTSWRLLDYTTPDGAAYRVPAALTPSATFAGGSISGDAGCNRFSGSYTVDGASIEIGPLATTRMACAAPIATIETAYLEALGLVDTHAVEGDILRLTGAGGTPMLRYARASVAALVGTLWIATGVNNGTGGVSSMAAGTSATAAFAADGSVSGSSGCNTYSGPYATDATRIAIGPLSGTKKLCGSPEGVDAQEARFLEAMQKAARHVLAGDVLELLAADGALLVSFEALGG